MFCFVAVGFGKHFWKEENYR